MTKPVKVRHVITGLTEELTQEFFNSIAFTPLHKVYEVLPDDYDMNCVSCGEDPEPEDIEEDEENDLGDGYDFYDEEEDK